VTRHVLSRGADGRHEYGVAEGPDEGPPCYAQIQTAIGSDVTIWRCCLGVGHLGPHKSKFYGIYTDDRGQYRGIAPYAIVF
jgi:hypothetical protein